MDSFLLRKIKPEDNPAIEQIIKAIFLEFNMPLVGTAYEDKETPKMYESYLGDKEVYFILEYNGIVVGGGGIKPLKDFNNEVCELQKMYFSPSIRGQGLGKKMFNTCMQAAKDFGYKKCYLETFPDMTAAINLYKKNGFKQIDKALGNTSHYSCNVWMLKNLIIA